MVAGEEEAGGVSGLAEVDHHHAVLKFLSCRKAGADPEAIPAWIEEGRRRAVANMPPFSGGVHGGRRRRPRARRCPGQALRVCHDGH